mmetsp:Transcript_26658/g.87405  ORF Transcript_26658/g.87405 Transcript_26658/m.87405 type:complete len:200 (+) Transcript_26658:1703-2302(+)
MREERLELGVHRHHLVEFAHEGGHDGGVRKHRFEKPVRCGVVAPLLSRRPRGKFPGASVTQELREREGVRKPRIMAQRLFRLVLFREAQEPFHLLASERIVIDAEEHPARVARVEREQQLTTLQSGAVAPFPTQEHNVLRQRSEKGFILLMRRVHPRRTRSRGSHKEGMPRTLEREQRSLEHLRLLLRLSSITVHFREG